MKKQLTNNFTKTQTNKFNTNSKFLSVAKKPTYIYTEEDLGEGILDVGVTYK